MTGTIDIDHLRTWIGRSEEAEDIATARLAESYLAVMDAPDVQARNGDLAPLGLHWCLSPQVRPMSDLGLDGHPQRGGLLPPVPLSNRMWAGGRLEFPGRIRVGDVISKRSTVEDVVVKQGRSGPLCFVTVSHEFSGPDGVALRERQDLVFREPGPRNPPPPTPVAQWSRSVMASPVLLFRYSAITFNGHRIHYDRDHATRAEGYDGLVVHGPLQATMMLEFAASLRAAPPAAFDFRGVSPMTDGAAFTVNAADAGDHLSLWTADAQGRLCMTGSARW